MNEKNETRNDLTLEEWTQQVDALFWDHFSIGVYEILGDFNSWDMWDGEMSPAEAFDDLRGDVEIQIEDMMDFAATMK